VSNYKSFHQEQPLRFGKGINMITGQNNAGKTALLEALTLQFGPHPHRSLVTMPAENVRPPGRSAVTFVIEIDRDELQDLLTNEIETFWLPSPINAEGHPAAAAAEAWRIIRHAPHLSIQCGYTVDASGADNGFRLTRNPSFGLYEARHFTESEFLRFVRRPGRADINYADNAGRGAANGVGTTDLGIVLAEAFRHRVYSFKAERLNIGQARFGNSRELAANASNLPEVLGGLQANRALLDDFHGVVRRVLPQVERVSVRPRRDVADVLEILVWSNNGAPRREDLAVPLAESGTGIGQVLAIAYVLVTATFPRTFVIDEPNTFLHPGAAKALVEVMRSHDRHQFVLSTHAPGIMAVAEPEIIHWLAKPQEATIVRQIDVNETSKLRDYLAEMGTNLAEVFGADRILWVEGDTEERAFPLIVRRLLRLALGGTAIIAVSHTGDFDRKRVRQAVDVYRRLSGGVALLPAAVGFIFDREERTPEEMARATDESRGLVSFLTRRTYENFLLNGDGIAAVLNALPAFEANPTTGDRVREWIAAHGDDVRYSRHARADDEARWTSEVDAPRLLAAMFQELSETREAFSKTRDSVALTVWLLENAPEALREVAELIRAKLLPQE